MLLCECRAMGMPSQNFKQPYPADYVIKKFFSLVDIKHELRWCGMVAR